VLNGLDHTLTVFAGGIPAPRYQWFKGISPIANATNSTYTIVSMTASNIGGYYCAVSNVVGTIHSRTALINYIPPASFTLFPLTHTWRYQQNLNLDSDPTWVNVSYNDSSWPEGPGALGFEPDLPSVIGTQLVDPNIRIAGETVLRTYYFRTTFNWPGTSVGTLTLSNKIDDGAVFYLNGTEVARFNMPTGAVSYATRSATSRPGTGWNVPNGSTDGGGDANGWDTVTLGAEIHGILVPGQNTLAVSLHQPPSSSSDSLFGAVVAGSYLFEPLTVQRQLELSSSGV
jgi:hypothetical protein